MDKEKYDDGDIDESKDEFNYFIIPIKTDNVMISTFDDGKFQKGINDYSYIAGKLTALINTGVTPLEALNFILNQDTFKFNTEINKLICEKDIEVSKNQANLIEKTSQL